MRKEFLALGALILLAALFFAYQYATHEVAPATDVDQSAFIVPEGAVVVTLSKDGFSPSELFVRVGETVAFRSVTGDLFWPASNLHPSHLMYPEFDPEEPVEPDAVWSFTFTKVGEWKYHDHLAPYYTGVITVTE